MRGVLVVLLRLSYELFGDVLEWGMVVFRGIKRVFERFSDIIVRGFIFV